MLKDFEILIRRVGIEARNNLPISIMVDFVAQIRNTADAASEARTESGPRELKRSTSSAIVQSLLASSFTLIMLTPQINHSSRVGNLHGVAPRYPLGSRRPRLLLPERLQRLISSQHLKTIDNVRATL